MNKVLYTLSAMLGLLIIILLVNTVLFTSKQVSVSPLELIEVDKQAVASRLSNAVQLKTVSNQNSNEFDATAILQLHQHLANSFPQVHATLEKTVINQFSLLYKWNGINTEQKPVILMAHLDVVPIEPETAPQWEHPPFSGLISDGFVWGRGTLDNKSNLTAQLEAIENLIKSGFRPERTIFLAYGHDEETGGEQGARAIADHLKKQGVQASFTLDEGMMIVDKKLSPIKKNTGIIGIAEKGYLTLKVLAREQGGHSSMPPEKLTLLTLAHAIESLVSNQLPASLSGSSGALFDYLGPEMPFLQKMLFANRWLFEPVILMVLERQKTTNAMLRTTTAPTMIQGGVKENVLPSQAHVLVNFRILPGETPQSVLAHAKKVIDDPAVEVQIHQSSSTPPSRVSRSDSEAFHLIAKSLRQVFPGTVITPGLLLAATDSKHYETVADDNYRFSPFTLGPDDIPRIHGNNERIGLEDYAKMIQFYVQLIRNTADL
ncbi:MAG: M20 family peptidase [SAR324 cluster bacterium]|nr:M20 family peptidase [SAR324 cluster bacterium]